MRMNLKPNVVIVDYLFIVIVIIFVHVISFFGLILSNLATSFQMETSDFLNDCVFMQNIY